MKSKDVFSFAFGAVRLRKMRAGLTILGIVIGIAAIVALTSITTGLQVTITSELGAGFSSDTVTVSTQSFGMFGGGSSDFTLLVNDTDTINEIDGVQTSAAIMSKSVMLDFGSTELPLSVTGVDYTAYASIYSSFVAEEGSIPETPANDSVVIGSRLTDPWDNGTVLAEVGDTILISWTHRVGLEMVEENYTAEVVAVLEEIGGFSMGPSDLGLYIPLSTAQSFFDTDEVNSIAVQLVSDDEEFVETVSQAIEDAFDGLVSVISPTALLAIMSSIFDIISLFLVGIAGISLLVAGIGIMNIMIVSLMERTREIGILKALGMKSRTVLGIFLTEALVVGLVGAVVGVVTGYSMAVMFAAFSGSMFGGGMLGGGQSLSTGMMTITPVLTTEIILGAMAFGVFVAVVFALYPAWRASKLNPVDALRHE
ncbi:MAG: ABC transporter permease [Candidatus Thorarchaeota archaeon]|nr:ABC transporter permease [Candidatus Thorarchaeota archaeon]